MDVSPNSVYQMTCASATFELDDRIGPAKQSGNALEDQKVVEVSTAAAACGRVMEKVTSAATTVKVSIASAQKVNSGNTNAIVG